MPSEGFVLIQYGTEKKLEKLNRYLIDSHTILVFAQTVEFDYTLPSSVSYIID